MVGKKKKSPSSSYFMPPEMDEDIKKLKKGRKNERALIRSAYDLEH